MLRSIAAFAAAAVLLAPPANAFAQTTTASLPSIVPAARSLIIHGGAYTIPPRITIAAATADERNVAAFAQQFFTSRGIQATVAAASQNAQLALTTDPALNREGYRLHVDAGGMRITGGSGAGLFYGLQTLEQLVSPSAVASIPNIDVDDAPQYRWRGIHLDVSRHFFPVAVVERYIDVAAHYKLNVFHWHLTDDQGWRIDIKRYPRLAQVGGCRDGTQIGDDRASSDGKRYCGYYTQNQIREVVAYASRRYVTVVPEIEMPGHSLAALAAYPWLACTPGPFAVLQHWGGSKNILCPTPRTFTFVRNVLAEVMALFPGPYVHIGGDEVQKQSWESSTFVHELMAREHLGSYEAVQGYFTRTVERFIDANGRRMVGWDEILEGGVSPSATIMSWRGIEGGMAAARAGNDVVMSPDPPLYLDHYQGDPTVEPLAIGGYTTLERLYNYNPMPPGLTAQQQTHILGAQGNLWTEYVPTPELLFYRLLPRELAVAEMTWTAPERRNWPDFEARMPAQYAWMEQQHYPFHIPNPSLALIGPAQVQFASLQPNLRSSDVMVAQAAATVTIADDVPDAVIHYTVDGSDPRKDSPEYRGPVALTLAPGERKAIRAVAVLPDGRISFSSELVIYRHESP